VPQVGQARQNEDEGSGRVHLAHSGWVRVPPRTGWTWPQPAQQAQRCWQAKHHGAPVVLEIQQGAKRPQIEHVIVGAGWQV